MGSASRLALAYYGASSNPLGANALGRLDAILSNKFVIGVKTVDLTLRLSRLADSSVSYLRPTDIGVARYNSPYQGLLQASLRL
jgi:hypothetical protein